MTYYNTTHESGQMLIDFTQKARNQEEMIYAMFQKHLSLSPHQLERWLIYEGVGYPLTSIRRAITNLTIQGKLVKTEMKRRGKYGRPETIYRLR